MPFKRKIVTPQAPKRSTRKVRVVRRKVRAIEAGAARKIRSIAR